MVKTMLLGLIVCVTVLAGCGLRSSERASPEVLVIATGRLGRTVSLVRAGQTLVAIYSDRETAGLYSVDIPLSDSLPAAPPAPGLIDRIDTMPPLSPSFGEHSASANGSTVAVLYLARAAEGKPVLKLASRDPGAQAWNLDAIEPPGDPVAIIPSGPNRLDLFWAAGSLLWLSYPGNGAPEPLMDSFEPTERAGTFAGRDDQPGDSSPESASASPRGITVYDSISRSLVAFQWNGFAYDSTRVDGAAPIHSSVLLPDGRLAVLSWDQKTRRLELLEERLRNAGISRTLVTLCEGTSAVDLLQPPQDPDRQGASGGRDAAGRLLFLYDEARSLGGGKAAHELSLLAPSGGPGRRYHRIVLLSGGRLITDFSAVEVGDILYVLVRQDGVKLLRMKLPR